MAKFEVFKDTKGEFRFRLKASNGQVIATGESYKTKTGALNGIAPSNATPPTPPSSTSPPNKLPAVGPVVWRRKHER